MRNFKYILLLISFSIILYGCQDPVQPNEDNVPQNIILKSESKWLLDIETGNPLSKVYYKEYDKSGNLLRKINYNTDGLITSSSNYSYKGNSAFEHRKEFENGALIDEKSLQYDYDENGNVIKEVSYDENGNEINITSYLYDNDGNVLVKEVLDPVSGNIKKTIYKYELTDKGQVKERKVFVNGADQYISKDKFVYDQDNNSFNVHSLDAQDQVKTITTYFYHLDGRIKEEIVSDDKGNIIKKYSMEYLFY